MKSIYKFIPVVFFTLLFSCSDNEEFIPEQQNAKNYPETFTPENWREFIGAPKEVMESMIAKHKDLEKQEAIEYPDLTPEIYNKSKNPSGLTFGKIQVINQDGSRSYLGNTLVEIVKDSVATAGISTFSPFYLDNNFVIEQDSGTVCYYHKRKKDGNFAYSEWISGVTIADAITILNHINQNIEFDELWQYAASDVDANGRIEEADVQMLLNLITGVITELPNINGNTNQPVIYLTQDEYLEFQSDFDFWLPYASFFYTFPDCRGAGANLVSLDRYAVKRGDANSSWNRMD
ncbi:dockerin type I repeat-containing protein [Aquimarina gracilis]|uniref:Dockerin type I repeat-containing protein n=1 Tax=Aquimarina gracilis TaxID=874422 RepID=A0ABU6A1Q9_9FLAO|nr:dockerin type I repeat-containing protein [Aquimarina gracilis]MEB3348103.1 dockerin type I repeat-containing protein [Aquimarina gracilis]